MVVTGQEMKSHHHCRPVTQSAARKVLCYLSCALSYAMNMMLLESNFAKRATVTLRIDIGKLPTF